MWELFDVILMPHSGGQKFFFMKYNWLGDHRKERKGEKTEY
jgi:hypothetical protein